MPFCLGDQLYALGRSAVSFFGGGGADVGAVRLDLAMLK